MKKYNKIFDENVYFESFTKYLKAVSFINNFNYKREKPNHEICHHLGSSTLLATQSSNQGEIVLFLPSLINKSYILDLDKNNSIFQYIASTHSPYLINWEDPEGEELGFDIDDYVLKRIIPYLETLHKKHNKKIVVLGYCLGAIMALAASLVRPDLVKALGLVAAPWDFSASRLRLIPHYQHILSSYLDKNQVLPKQYIRDTFLFGNLDRHFEAYTNFFHLKDNKLRMEKFLAVESWLRDGIDLPSKVAKTAFIDWGYYNLLSSNEWEIAGTKIDPSTLKIPTLLSLAKKDHIVPYDSSLPLANLIPNPHIITTELGHISAIIGEKAKIEVWKPLNNWLTSLQ